MISTDYPLSVRPEALEDASVTRLSQVRLTRCNYCAPTTFIEAVVAAEEHQRKGIASRDRRRTPDRPIHFRPLTT
ncbi:MULTISPECIES: hypothetical protein [unclassified Nocardia]|uniref:hypothetical protein n=1 Tax=unclassified Nocardia TaxID=2637762 RepID=UPI0035DEF2D3